MRAEFARLDRVLAWMAVAGGACLIALVAWEPRPALAGWLAAATGLAAVPSGALILAMTMRLIPGAWGEELRLSAEAATLLTPLAALGFVPVLLGMGAIYAWDQAPMHSAFQRAWLSPLFFAGRTIAWFAMLEWLGRRMRQRRRPIATATAGLVALTVMGSAMGIDWLMSLDPEFASSAFGLQHIARSVTIAFCAMLLLRLLSGRPPRRLGVAGAVLLTLLLLWAYFEFLPFFIVWSSNLPQNVGWYANRTGTGWVWASGAFTALQSLPLLALLFARVRQTPACLIAAAASVLLGEGVQLAWITLPGQGMIGIVAFALSAFVVIASGSLALRLGLRVRVRARRPTGAG